MSKKKKSQKPIVVKKERFIQISVSLGNIIYILGILTFTFIVWYLLYFEWIEIYINKSKNKRESFLFSILVSMTLLMFQLACGFDIKFSNNYLRFVIIAIVLILVYYGYQNYGLGFIINQNYNMLYHITYESNSKEGLLFFTHNWLFWSFVFIASLILMNRDD